jgi:hypothetical protein
VGCRELLQRCTKDGPDRLCCPTTPNGTPLECRGPTLSATCRKVRLQSRKRWVAPWSDQYMRSIGLSMKDDCPYRSEEVP